MLLFRFFVREVKCLWRKTRKALELINENRLFGAKTTVVLAPTPR